MKKSIASLCLALGTLVSAASASAAVVVSFTPSSQHVNVGDTVTVDVNISGLGAEILSAYDLNFFYNGAVLGLTRSANATSAFDQLGAAYGAAPGSVFDVTSLGEWGLQMYAFEDDAIIAANQADSFLLARFGFSADADGVSQFGLGLDPDFERNFVGLNALSLDVIVGKACIAVGTGSCEVPEPGTLALLGAALAGAVLPRALRRRRQQKGVD